MALRTRIQHVVQGPPMYHYTVPNSVMTYTATNHPAIGELAFLSPDGSVNTNSGGTPIGTVVAFDHYANTVNIQHSAFEHALTQLGQESVLHFPYELNVSGGSYAAAQVHAEIRQQMIEADSHAFELTIAGMQVPNHMLNKPVQPLRKTSWERLLNEERY